MASKAVADLEAATVEAERLRSEKVGNNEEAKLPRPDMFCGSHVFGPAQPRCIDDSETLVRKLESNSDIYIVAGEALRSGPLSQDVCCGEDHPGAQHHMLGDCPCQVRPIFQDFELNLEGWL